ncbi:hypothetical protein [Streptomyces roseolus]|uniref:hypothetical protein n=1 Tax=Streptomyces roseolus TaxID=67358 RepID=UPI00199E4EAA|nr:hypothetical protein [Streptomyces roseolus]GGR28339.1 hypothetical protein GCM10010282_20910 [Streptomyces roseolus]
MYELAILTRGGVLLTARALAAGWPPGRLAARLRRDGWQRIRPGAWAAPGKETDWRVRETALQLLRPGRVCRHGTAARVHRIELLTGPPPPEASRSSLPPEDVCLRRGLRVTTAARTVADLIRTAGSREAAVVTADSALSRRVVEGVRRDPLVRYEELAAQLAVRRPGAPRARAWLPLVHPASGSPAETVARLRMADAALRPECQPQVRPPGAGPCARTSSSGPRAWRWRSRGTRTTAPPAPTNGTSPASTPSSPAPGSAACSASRRGRSSRSRGG